MGMTGLKNEVDEQGKNKWICQEKQVDWPGKTSGLARKRNWIGQEMQRRIVGWSRMMKWQSQGCPAEEFSLLALDKLLPLLVVPLLEVPLLEVLPEVLLDPPEVEVLSELAELSEVAGLWEAGPWKGLWDGVLWKGLCSRAAQVVVAVGWPAV